jgi:hypothetical protein
MLLFSPKRGPRTAGGGVPLSFLFNGYQRFCPRGQSGRNLKVSTRLLVMRYMSEVIRMISGFRLDVNLICAILGFYAAYNASSLPTFRDNLSIPSSRVKQSSLVALLDI